MSATKKPKEEAKVFNNEKYKDDFGKYKKRFFSDVEDVLEKTSLSPKKDVGRYQYEDVVYWFYVELPKEKLKEEYSNIFGIHIMPYCITEEDIINAEKNIGRSFRDEHTGYVDFDINTHNYHKYTDIKNPRYQVVLIPRKKDGKKAGGPKGLKGNCYFPEIAPKVEMFENKLYKEEERKEDLRKSILKAFETILVKTEYEKYKTLLE